MAHIVLDIRFPDSLPVEQVADIHHVIADAAHRARDWNDQAQWSITQLVDNTLTVTTPLARAVGR